ncbi:hypothetical protein B0J11DRAFT_617455 [Dendryphion nanum]|uniref:NACHT domain-containing protein n=1 Tax=Dendryphion nanum TaxID=256645 RepID=A0A9P9IE99_9PLEO|nr:hypothetical protein B0J11DRAFT_617455 [Dendryphion nanum]
MEPFSALAVANSAVQFIDFTCKVLAESYKLRTSTKDQLGEYETVVNVTTQLRDISLDLATHAGNHQGTSNLSQDDKNLQELCQSCHSISVQLLGALDKLKVNCGSSKWDTFRQAFCTVWSREEIEALERKLDKFRQQLVVGILVSLRHMTLDAQTHNEHVRSTTREIQQDNKNLGQLFLKHTSDSKRWQSDLLQAIRASHGQESAYDSVPPFHRLIDSYRSSCAYEFQTILLQRLQYKEIRDRYERIKDAHKSTFEWIFENFKKNDHQWQNFADFLQNDTDLFWITGKAGAGKSTLMKFLSEHPRTRQLLGTTSVPDAKSLELVCAGFYFWNSGTAIQMSKEALLRTLLHETLKSCQPQIPIIFPDLWEAYYLLNTTVPDRWMWSELVSGFHRLVRLPGKKFFFLVDGLDEFSNDASELVYLIDFLKSLAEHDNVKLCVSSRPWPVFEDAFERSPSLKIEDLTFKDIENYVYDHLLEHPGYSDLAIDQPTYTCSLANRITRKSEGVFLWVNLVLKSLLFGITDGDQTADLDARLASLPSDLEELFHKMLNSMNPLHKRQGCQLLVLFRLWKNNGISIRVSNNEDEECRTGQPLGGLPLIQMYLADSNDLYSVINSPLQEYTSEEIASKSERMRRRLNSRCKGLLECRSQDDHEASVYWLHRTVADFIYRHETWSWILKEAGGDTFHPAVNYCASFLHRLKRLPRSPIWSVGNIVTVIVSFSNLSVRTSNGITAHPLVSILEELDKSIRQLIELRPEIWSLSGDKYHSCIDRLVDLDLRGYPASFLNVAVHNSMDWYIQEQMLRKKLTVFQPSATPLLLCASKLCYNDCKRGRIPDVTMVETLLKCGLDPNVSVKGQSLMSMLERRIDSGEGSHDGIWWEAHNLLMQYGGKKKSEAKEEHGAKEISEAKKNRRSKRQTFFGLYQRF